MDDPGAPQPALQAEEIRVACRAYFSVPAAAESDHKPVLASLAVSMPITDQVTAPALRSAGSQTRLLFPPRSCAYGTRTLGRQHPRHRPGNSNRPSVNRVLPAYMTQQWHT